MLQITPSYVALTRGLDMQFASILSDVNITTTGTISTTGTIFTTGTVSSNTLTTNALTTTGSFINMKSDLVLFKGLAGLI